MMSQALESIADALRVEVKAFGIDVMVIQPVRRSILRSYDILIIIDV
jgi:hypothetical protein